MLTSRLSFPIQGPIGFGHHPVRAFWNLGELGYRVGFFSKMYQKRLVGFHFQEHFGALAREKPEVNRPGVLATGKHMVQHTRLKHLQVLYRESKSLRISG